jgi:hypothetical protein
MDGRAFLSVARELIRGRTEAHWRSSAGRSYYALFLECRDALARWGFTLHRHATIHHFVRQRFVIPSFADLFFIGERLDRLGQLRSKADYEISASGKFATDGAAVTALTWATDALTRLDAIEADPAVRTAAVAAIRTAFL